MVFRLIGGRLLTMFLILVIVVIIAYVTDLIFGIASAIYSWLTYLGMNVQKISVTTYIDYALYAFAIGSIIGIIVILLTSIRGERW